MGTKRGIQTNSVKPEDASLHFKEYFRLIACGRSSETLSSVHAFTASIPFCLQSPAFWQWSWDSLPQDSSGRLFLLWAQEWTTHLKFKQLIVMVSSWTIIIWMFTLIIGRFRKAVGPWLSFEGAGPNKTDSSILEAKLRFYVGFRAGFRIFHVDFRSRSKILIRFLSPDL